MIGPLIVLVASLATLAFVIHNERCMRRHQRETKRLVRETWGNFSLAEIKISASEYRLRHRTGGGRYPRSPTPHP